MGLQCGIVGLPNVGKSTIFKAITSAPAEAANYPFCTIEPNLGIVAVPDKRLQKIADLVGPEKTIPAIVEFLDIAGLVKGASKGEGLGNQFLGHIRSVGAIVHVVRCFEDNDIIHVHGKVNPADDIETINIELALADLESVQKKLNGLDKLFKSQDKQVQTKAKIAQPVLQNLVKVLEQGKAARTMPMDKDEREAIADLQLITMKKILYACNVDEETIFKDNEHVQKVRDIAQKDGAKVVKICGKIESEISTLDTEAEKKEFLDSLGIEESGLSQLITAGYELLDLRTYFTAGKKEVRAWTFHAGAKAPEAAGVIHSDFEKGFIRAEVYHCDDLFNLGTEVKVKEAGKFRVEGKEYVVKDGDVMHFRFNV
ncbi:MAG: redox-regulated ATPase YchF [Bacteriovoracaceae bacterium]|nr:redox-regulated ATPase YchF [Bacteriovoracaceae bacterium]